MTLMATAKKAASPVKAAAKKTAARVAKPKPAPPRAPKGTTPPPAEEATTGKSILFQGRSVLVRLPDADQIVVWRKIVRQLQNAGPNIDAERVFTLLDRGRRIVDSVIELEADREWLDDLLLDRVVTLRETVEIIILAMKAYHPDAPIPEFGAAEIE